MPYVKVHDQYINPLLVTNIDVGEINKVTTTEDGETVTPGLKTKEVVPFVRVTSVGGHQVCLDGTDNIDFVAELLNAGLDACLKLCASPVPIQPIPHQAPPGQPEIIIAPPK